MEHGPCWKDCDPAYCVTTQGSPLEMWKRPLYVNCNPMITDVSLQSAQHGEDEVAIRSSDTK